MASKEGHAAERLGRIVDIDKELSRIQDLDLLVERILLHARRAVNADAGTVYIRDEDNLAFRHAQNETKEALLEPGQKLIYTFFTVPIDDSSVSGYAAAHGEMLNIPDMYAIPVDAPYSFNSSYDKSSGYKTVSSLTIPLVSSDKDLLGVLQLLNARDKLGRFIPFDKKDEPFLTHIASIATMALQRAQLTRTLLIRMIELAGLRDPKETGAHVNRVGSYATEIYEAWALRQDMDDEERDRNKDVLRMAAMLHDVGKVGISDIVLKKPGRFTDDEYRIMQSHTWVGARLFSGKTSELDRVAAEVALYHHENWDGSGYPGKVDLETADKYVREVEERPPGLKGEEIPLFARIVSLADVYDALSSKRVYKDAWTEEDVLEEIRKSSGKKFDPELVDIFFSVLPRMKHIRDMYPDKD